MIRRAGHLVDDGLVLDPPGALPGRAAGIDLVLAAARVSAAGGHGGRFRHFLGRALALSGGAGREAVLALVAAAAWRSGVLQVRGDALRRLAEAPGAGGPPPDAAAAALGLPAGDLGWFVEAQERDPYAWPGWDGARREVARVGGFSGLGGPWPRPPARAVAAPGAGRFVTWVGADPWLVDVDVFAALLRPAGEDGAGPAPNGPGADGPDDAGARALVTPTSHLLVVETGHGT